MLPSSTAVGKRKLRGVVPTGWDSLQLGSVKGASRGAATLISPMGLAMATMGNFMLDNVKGVWALERVGESDVVEDGGRILLAVWLLLMMGKDY